MFYLYDATTGKFFNGIEFADVFSYDEIKYFKTLGEAVAASPIKEDWIKVLKFPA
jgi:hypothetical protein